GGRRPGEACLLAFSPDGRVLAGGCDDVSVVLWDATDGAGLRRLRGHRDLVSALGFAADGRSLASGSSDTTVLVWDLGDLSKQLVGRGLPKELVDMAWLGLAERDAALAHRYLVALLEHPERAVALLRERLRPVPRLARRLDQLIA